MTNKSRTFCATIRKTQTVFYGIYNAKKDKQYSMGYFMERKAQTVFYRIYNQKKDAQYSMAI